MKLGSVSYKNCLPLLYGLHEDFSILRLPPAALTQALLQGEIDLALVPTFAIHTHGLYAYPETGIIGCQGAVRSVGLFTRPYIETLDQVRSVFLDPESLTSAYLTKILLKKMYGLSLYDVEFFHEDNRHKADAELLIGDKALWAQQDPMNHRRFWDLGSLWHEFTQQGFIFATWASRQPVAPEILAQLAQTRVNGLKNLEPIVAHLPQTERAETLDYFQNHIVYEAQPSLLAGYHLYRNYLREFHYGEPWGDLNPADPQVA